MKQQGIVIERKKGNILEIKITPHETCHKCGACSTKSVNKITFCGEISESIHVGDNVEIEVESGYLVFSYFIVYICPLLCFFPIIFFLFKFTSSPIISFAGGVCGIFFFYILIGILFRKQQQFSKHLKIRKT